MEDLYTKHFFICGMSLLNLHKYIKYFPHTISKFKTGVASNLPNKTCHDFSNAMSLFIHWELTTDPGKLFQSFMTLTKNDSECLCCISVFQGVMSDPLLFYGAILGPLDKCYDFRS